MADSGIVRNRAKIEATIGNAKAALELESLDDFLWSFVDGRPLRNSWKALSEMPAETPESKAMSKELKRRGFRFVGPTICYAFMQAAGLVNDHTVDCFRYREVA
jgi:DNA-3-methyladenine glycosylase I